jgi:hypothetical protein
MGEGEAAEKGRVARQSIHEQIGFENPRAIATTALR